jgi:hypothetical protein
MPTSEQILLDLGEIANEWRFLALIWHVYFGILAVALLWGTRPSKRVMGILLGVPLLSVSTLAWMTANPFNGVLLGLFGSGLIGISLMLARHRVMIAPVWAVLPGILLFMFGWLYPHFLDTSSFFPYVYSAPTGLIPCPTLSIVTGLALILGGLGSRVWSFVLAAAGIFYGIFGAVHLDVALDWVLVAGAVALVAAVTRPA